MNFRNAAASLLLLQGPSTAESIRRVSSSVGSDHDGASSSTIDGIATKNKNLRSLQGLDMSMSMPATTDSIVQPATESDGDDSLVTDVLDGLKSFGVVIPKSEAMEVINSNEQPAHHSSEVLKCRWLVTLLFFKHKNKYFHFFGLSDEDLDEIVNHVCGTPSPTATPTKEPTDSPSHEPTDAPSHEPTDSPSHEPTDSPTSCTEVVVSDVVRVEYSERPPYPTVEFNFTSLPPASSDVTLTVAARGDLGQDEEYLNITVQDIVLGTVGNEKCANNTQDCFNPTCEDEEDCNLIPKVATFTILETDFNSYLAAKNSTLLVQAIPSDAVDSFCDDNDVNVTLTYKSCP